MNTSPNGIPEHTLASMDLIFSLNPTFVARGFSGDIKLMTRILKAAVLDGSFEYTGHQFDVTAKATGNEGGVEREDQVHARQRMLGDPVGACVHWLALWCERTRLPGR